VGDALDKALKLLALVSEQSNYYINVGVDDVVVAFYETYTHYSAGECQRAVVYTNSGLKIEVVRCENGEHEVRVTPIHICSC
jgi:hypothetical protein